MQMPLSFEVVIYEGESGWLLVECPALPGCMSQGKTEEECLANISDAIGVWIEVQLEKRKEQATHIMSMSPTSGCVSRKEVRLCLAGA